MHSVVCNYVRISDCCMSLSMSRILIVGILTFSYLQLAVGQDALASNIQSCTATAENPRVICTGQCRRYNEDIINNCAPEVSLVRSYIFCKSDRICKKGFYPCIKFCNISKSCDEVIKLKFHPH